MQHKLYSYKHVCQVGNDLLSKMSPSSINNQIVLFWEVGCAERW